MDTLTRHSKTFDTVNLEMLKRALNKIKLPKKVIVLADALNA